MRDLEADKKPFARVLSDSVHNSDIKLNHSVGTQENSLRDKEMLERRCDQIFQCIIEC
ncbi:hypothetical protein M758_UG044200 [Ceratodon purpureus]|nr:hypothetical protein M758_UG044200 [Ceratodon purpureus]